MYGNATITSATPRSRKHSLSEFSPLPPVAPVDNHLPNREQNGIVKRQQNPAPRELSFPGKESLMMPWNSHPQL